ncbi:MAG: redoxin domain-containing protein [Alphaproteobacteria bacterium]|nr:redoxin domain-containing protein [Alphaproteobacteria bacterium]
MTGVFPVRVTKIVPGDIAPGFQLISSDGHRFDFDDHAVSGRFTVLVFGDQRQISRVLDALAQHRETLTAAQAHVLGVVRGEPDRTAPFPVFRDQEEKVAKTYGTAGTGSVFVVAPNRHVLNAFSAGDEPSAIAAATAALIDRHSRAFKPRLQSENHPPVLVVPDVLSSSECQKLVSVYRMDGNVMVEPGHGQRSQSADYKMRIPEYGRNDRIDHWIVRRTTDEWIDRRLQERLFPEIFKAYQYPITRRENYRIGCYEGARGGELHGHRDNTEPVVAHRRFAMSINLNSEDFVGGELAFPEYGGQRYRPPSGAAIVFSSSILHELHEVTKGRRYVLLAFLFGER